MRQKAQPEAAAAVAEPEATAPQDVPESPSTAVVPAEPQALEQPPADAAVSRGRGKLSSVTMRDLEVPRLAGAQRGSPQVDPDQKGSYIPGLQLYDLFMTVTNMKFGRGPVQFVVVRSNMVAKEFDPVTKKVIDFNVPVERYTEHDAPTPKLVNEFKDERLRFTDGPNGTRLKPRATLFYEYLVVLDTPRREMALLSFKTTQIKVAKKLNSLLEMYDCDSWETLFQLTSGSKTTNDNTHVQYAVGLAEDPNPSAELKARALGLWQTTEGVRVRTSDADAEAQANEKDGEDDHIPF